MLHSPAPKFQAIDSFGDKIDFPILGKWNVLYFYPKDNTPGCTAQACSTRDGLLSHPIENMVIFGVSPDSMKSHAKFIEKFALNFPLFSDEDHSIAQAYGVWGEKKFMGKTYMGVTRKTFLIDPAGKIAHIIDKVDTKNAFSQINTLIK
ncbi:MAG: thioredoxin-dependent thiol peroxidase [Chitinophagales bacterium]|jgi:peroxiredoxin Q/BCP|nr:thioredoxin-dependent thiol peroxidase [Chitinophagales bacterium]